jgi:hypothetical protein
MVFWSCVAKGYEDPYSQDKWKAYVVDDEGGEVSAEK